MRHKQISNQLIFIFFSRDEIEKQLKLIRSHLNDLKKHRNELQVCETQLNSLSQQMALVREAETLGTAMESHQLGSVSQRYSVYRRTRDEFEAAKAVFVKKVEDCDKLMSCYRNCLDTIHSDDIYAYTQEAEELLSLSLNSEFDIICEFLEQTAQTQMYTQCDQTRRELDSCIKQQMRIVHQTFETFLQYGDVMKFYPAGQHNNHRCAKYSQWSKYLLEHKQVQSCRDVVAQYHAAHDRSGYKQIFECVISFNRHIQSNITNSTNSLQKLLDKLNNEFGYNGDINRVCKHQENLFKEAKSSVNLFLTRETGAQNALNVVIFSTLCDMNKRLLMIENAASSAGDNLAELTSNGKWFLDELHIFSTLSTELCSPLSHLNNSEANISLALDVLNATNQVYSSLRKMKDSFALDILPSALSGILSEDNSVLDMIATLSNLQNGLVPLTELLNNLKIYLRCITLNLPIPNSTTLNTAAELNSKLLSLKLDYEQNRSMNSLGRKLFLTFYEFFDKFDKDHNNLMNAVDKLDMGSNWIKLDQMKDAKNIGVS